MEMSQQEEYSIFMNFESVRVESHFHNPYSMDIYEMLSSSNSWVPSQTQPSESSSSANS